MSHLDQVGGVDGPDEVLRDVNTQELKAGHTLYLSSIDLDRCVWLVVVCQQSSISSLVFRVLKDRLT